MRIRIFGAALIISMLTCVTVSCAAKFDDTEENAWYYDAVNYVCDKGYFSGVSETEFKPDDKMTRGMFVTILGKMQGIDTANYQGSAFSDVPEGEWDAPYVSWAAQLGIATGYNDGCFHAEYPIDKEELCVLTARYLKSAEKNPTDNPNALKSYYDESVVSEWARDSVALLRSSGVILGDSNGYFRPRENATRSQTATIIMRLARVLEGEVLDIPPLSDRAEEILNQMSVIEKVYQIFVVTPEELTGASVATQAGKVTQEALAMYPVGGVMYKAQNLINAEQTQTMIEGTKEYCKIKPFITVDEEGGAVARVAQKLGTTKFSPMYYYRNAGTDKAYEIGATLANDLKQFGFNQDYAPIADVWTNSKNSVIASRAFSNNPDKAAEMVSAEVRGMRDNGMISTIKHFPGHGDTAEDSHSGKAYSYKYLDELMSCEFIPFKAGIAAGTDFVMCGHIVTPNVDESGYPATMSRKLVTDILRGELGFNGVIITDALDMHAVSSYYTSAEAAINCINAGCDMLLCPDTMTEAASAVIDAVNDGTISENRINESVKRILNKKIEFGIIK